MRFPRFLFHPADPGEIKGYVRSVSGAEAAPVVTQRVIELNEALIKRRDELRRRTQDAGGANLSSESRP